MSIKSKVLATAATLALVGGVGTAGVLGTAASRERGHPVVRRHLRRHLQPAVRSPR